MKYRVLGLLKPPIHPVVARMDELTGRRPMTHVLDDVIDEADVEKTRALLDEMAHYVESYMIRPLEELPRPTEDPLGTRVTSDVDYVTQQVRFMCREAFLANT